MNNGNKSIVFLLILIIISVHLPISDIRQTKRIRNVLIGYNWVLWDLLENRAPDHSHHYQLLRVDEAISGDNVDINVKNSDDEWLINTSGFLSMIKIAYSEKNLSPLNILYWHERCII